MRVKTVTIPDDGDYKIGALSVDQVEAVVGNVAEGGTGTTKVIDIVVVSLNNALKKSNPQLADDDPTLWTADKVRKNFDLTTLPIIKDEVLKFSSLRQEEQKEVGESPAAQAAQ